MPRKKSSKKSESHKLGQSMIAYNGYPLSVQYISPNVLQELIVLDRNRFGTSVPIENYFSQHYGNVPSPVVRAQSFPGQSQASWEEISKAPLPSRLRLPATFEETRGTPLPPKLSLLPSYQSLTAEQKRKAPSYESATDIEWIKPPIPVFGRAERKKKIIMRLDTMKNVLEGVQAIIDQAKIKKCGDILDYINALSQQNKAEKNVLKEMRSEVQKDDISLARLSAYEMTKIPKVSTDLIVYIKKGVIPYIEKCENSKDSVNSLKSYLQTLSKFQAPLQAGPSVEPQHRQQPWSNIGNIPSTEEVLNPEWLVKGKTPSQNKITIFYNGENQEIEVNELKRILKLVIDKSPEVSRMIDPDSEEDYAKFEKDASDLLKKINVNPNLTKYYDYVQEFFNDMTEWDAYFDELKKITNTRPGISSTANGGRRKKKRSIRKMRKSKSHKK